MRLAVFGKSGQLARALRHCIETGPYEAKFYGRQSCNFASSPEIIQDFAMQMPRVDVVVIAAAYTNVDDAEKDIETAFAINAIAPSIIAKVCGARSIPLIYISTDYVFDGKQTSPYTPDQLTNPLNVYGQSKRAGEKAITESDCHSIILRTSWLFDGHGENFMTTMLRLVKDGTRIKIIDDQIGRPTYLGDLADAVVKVASIVHSTPMKQSGIFHISNAGDPVSWAGFAREIFLKSRAEFQDPVAIDTISTQEYGQLARRPAYSVLDNASFEKTFGFGLPDWRHGLETALSEWRLRAR